jgi:leader peptidase (prepilin peptidase)/N-methyltransferase
MIRLLGTLFGGLLGLAFGSFLNVWLTRWPEGESVVKPRSHCRRCVHTLSWWENLPLVSWLALRGRCRFCQTWIGWRYPLVEAMVGGLWAVAAWRSLTLMLDPGLPPPLVNQVLAITVCMFVFLWLLVALAVLDAEHLWLPNLLTIPGIAIGFGYSLLKFSFHVRNGALTLNGQPMPNGFAGEQYLLLGIALKSIIAMLAAAAIVLLIRWVYWLVRRKEGMGLGDAKLMAMLAAWLGLPGALLSFSIGVIIGAIVAVGLLAIPKSQNEAGNWAMTKLPLGTFLCIGGIVSALWGEPIIAAYLRAMGL